MTGIWQSREFQALGAAPLRAARRAEGPARTSELLDKHGKHERGET